MQPLPRSRPDADSSRSDNCQSGRASRSTGAPRRPSACPSSETPCRPPRMPSAQATRDPACARAARTARPRPRGSPPRIAAGVAASPGSDRGRSTNRAAMWLNALALAVEQQAGEVLPHCGPALGPTEARGQGVDEGGQLTIEALQRVWRHTAIKSRADRSVKPEVTDVLDWAAVNLTAHETFTRLRYGANVSAGFGGFDFLRTNLAVIDFRPEDEVRARSMLTKYADHKISYHDAICAAIMLRSGIYKIFTFDRDFLILGFHVLP